MSWIELGALPADPKITEFCLGDRRFVFLQNEGTNRLYNSTCPHRGAPLIDAFEVEGRLVCSWHRSVFDCNSGEPLSGPACIPLSPYAVRVAKGLVSVHSGYSIDQSLKSISTSEHVESVQLEESSGGTLQLRNGSKLRFRHDMATSVDDLIVLDEVFGESTYACLEGKEPYDFVLDAGGQIGCFASLISVLGLAKDLVVLEPEQGNFELLSENIQDHKSFKALNKALSSDGKSFRLAINSQNMAGHSRYLSQTDSSVEVQSIALSQLIAEKRDAKRALLKLDIEGGEFEVLLNSSPDHIQFFDTIVFEEHSFPPFENDFRRKTLHGILTELGFEMRIHEEVWYPGEGDFRLVEANRSLK